MNKNIFTIAALLLLPLSIFAQDILIEYDAAGNRIRRHAVPGLVMDSDTTADPIYTDRQNSLDTNSEQEVEFGIHIFPNPVSELLQMNINIGTESTASLEIYSSSGQLIQRKDVGTGQQILEVGSLPAGQYSLLVRTSHKEEIIPFVKR